MCRVHCRLLLERAGAYWSSCATEVKPGGRGGEILAPAEVAAVVNSVAKKKPAAFNMFTMRPCGSVSYHNSITFQRSTFPFPFSMIEGVKFGFVLILQALVPTQSIAGLGYRYQSALCLGNHSANIRRRLAHVGGRRGERCSPKYGGVVVESTDNVN
jgi:hypothetical protein